MNAKSAYINLRPYTLIGYFFILGLTLLLIFVFTSDRFDTDEAVEFLDLPQPWLLLSIWGVFGGIGIWLWMLTSYFNTPPKKNRVLWGWSLIVGSYFASTLYFFAIYLPQKWDERR